MLPSVTKKLLQWGPARSDPQSDDLHYFKLRLLTSGNQVLSPGDPWWQQGRVWWTKPPQGKDKGAASQPLYHTVALNKLVRFLTSP